MKQDVCFHESEPKLANSDYGNENMRVWMAHHMKLREENYPVQCQHLSPYHGDCLETMRSIALLCHQWPHGTVCCEDKFTAKFFKL